MTELISKQESAYIQEIEGKLKEVWAKRQVFRTETEIRVSVLNDAKHPTKASKYWQAVREQSVFYEQLKYLFFEYRKNEVRIAKTKDKLSKATDEFKQQMLTIKLDELLFAREQMQQQGQDRIREIKLWDKIMTELDDGSFDTSNPNTHQMISLAMSLDNKVKCLNETSSADEVLNISGVYHTALRHLDEAGLLEKNGSNLRIKHDIL